ncbi:MAG: response regulator transcription factor [Clostridia bacterium]|nr:response regulator transcription factor [Clostridia bacterium]
MYRIVLCDDNAGFLSLFRDEIKEQFNRIMPDSSEYEIGPCFESGNEVLKYIESNKTDVIFLDIDMPEMSGFELAKILCRDYKNILVVFMSAYDTFVYESFDYLPFAYLRKEHIKTELPKVSLRIREKLLEPARYIVLPLKDKDIKIDAKDVLYFESIKNYYVAHLVSGKEYTCRGTISKLEEVVKGMDFFRTHSAFLVNMEHIEKVFEDGTLQIENTTIPISQKRAKEFRRAFSEYERRSMGI